MVGPVTKAVAGAAGGGAVAGTGVLGGLAASGALATIGWSLIGGAVAIKLLRMKGKKYSRLAALKRLMNSMVDVVPKSKPEQAVIQGLTSTGVIKPAEAPADEKKPEEEAAAESLCLDDEEQKTVRSLFANLPKQDSKVRAKSILRILNVLMNKQRFSKDAQKQFLQEALRDLLRSKILSELVTPTPKKDKTKPAGPGVVPKEPMGEPDEEKGGEEVVKEDCAPVPVGVQRTIMGLFRDVRKGDVGAGQGEVDRIVDLLEKYKVLDPLAGKPGEVEAGPTTGQGAKATMGGVYKYNEKGSWREKPKGLEEEQAFEVEKPYNVQIIGVRPKKEFSGEGAFTADPEKADWESGVIQIRRLDDKCKPTTMKGKKVDPTKPAVGSSAFASTLKRVGKESPCKVQMPRKAPKISPSAVEAKPMVTKPSKGRAIKKKAVKPKLSGLNNKWSFKDGTRRMEFNTEEEAVDFIKKSDNLELKTTKKKVTKETKLQEQKVFGIWQKYAGILKGNK